MRCTCLCLCVLLDCVVPARRRQLSLPFVAELFHQLASGVKQLHERDVLHRHLTTENAVVVSDEPLVVKWAGFQCATPMPLPLQASELSTCVGL